MRGELDDAARTCEDMLASGEAAGLADVDGPYGVHAFMVRRESGGLEQVRALVTGTERPEEQWAPGLLGLYTELRLAGPAARVLTWLMDDLGRQRGTAQWAGVLALLAEAALWLADRPVAERLRPLLAEYTGLNLMLGAFDGPFGSADRYLGALDSLLGRGDPDDLFASAWAMDTRMSSPVHQAHTLALHAAHRRRSGGAGEQPARLEARARAIAEPAGLVRVLRLLPPAGAGRPSRDDGLTPREVDVVRLLGEGRTNREIAVLLRISENTAANHVRSILVKTRSGNRTQAAIYARDRCWPGGGG